MDHSLSLCLQLFLDDSKMKNFITCFKGTPAPSSPTFLTPSGKALEGSAPQPRGIREMGFPSSRAPLSKVK